MLAIVLLLFNPHGFGDWIPSPSSDKSLFSWAESIELVPASGDRDYYIDWAQLSRLLLEDGDRIQTPKRCVLNKTG
jgi:hypothetical protein